MDRPRADLETVDPRATMPREQDGRQKIRVRGFKLHVLSEPDAGVVYTSSRPRTTIGTHEANDFVFDDPTMSRFHCEIAIQEGNALIRDLGSKNGTVLDGIRVEAAHLTQGVTMTLGQTRLRFDVGEDIEVSVSENDHFGQMVGTSTVMRALFALLERAAGSDATVLLQGETGTGKDLAAESIHAESERREQPFVAVDCGALPANIIESELFGHTRGAFTSADRDRAGAFEQASGGTLFLDEIGELPLDLQPKLLRVLESRVVKRVGGSVEIPVDVRVIAATNRDVQVEVNARRFRSDLYYRLAVLVIQLPGLREHLGDVEPIARALLGRLGGDAAELSDRLGGGAFFDELKRHRWPGNVRELRNYLERCLAFERPLPLLEPGGAELPVVDTGSPLRLARRQWVDYFEARYLEQILKENDDNVTRAARAAGVDRAHFHRLLARVRKK